MRKSILIASAAIAFIAVALIGFGTSKASVDLVESAYSPIGTDDVDKAYLQQSVEKVMSASRENGSVRIIVGLNVPFTPEGYVNEGQREEQRLAIRQAQDVFVTRYISSNVRILHKYDFIPFLVIETGEMPLQQMKGDSEITSITEDIAVSPSLAESASIVQAPAAWSSGFDGSGWAVAVLDTGVNKNHTFLTGKVISEACYSTNNGVASSFCPGGVTDSIAVGSGLNCDPSISGCPHGTHVAGIAAGTNASFSGVARNAKIIAIQVFSRFNNQSDCGSTPAPCALTYFSDCIKGLERVLALNATTNIASANMSLGGGRYFDQASCDAENAAFKAAIDNLRSVNVATVVSSMNNGYIDSMARPACISSAVSVGSTDDGSSGTTQDFVSDFSNSASFLNLLAPGRWINSSVAATGSNNSFQIYQGTSMASPHVAGAWAVLKQRSPTASVSTILTALTTTGLPVSDFRNGIVKPRIRINNALQTFGSATPTATGTPQCGTAFNFTGPAVAIPDNLTAGVNVAIPVSGVGTISDVNFRFGGTQNADPASTLPGINHSFVGDLLVKVTSPQGTTVSVFDRPGVPASQFGCNSNNLAQITLDDDGGFPSVENQCATDTAAFPIGTFSPNNAMSAFDGQNGNGTWIVNISDLAGTDTGSARAFSLVFGTSCATATNTPTGIATASATCTPGGASAVLYDQSNNNAGTGTSSQDFEPANDAFDDRAADDFSVPTEQTWTIQKVVVNGSYSSSGVASSFNVTFYSDFFNGVDYLPGSPIAGGTFTGLPFTSAGGVITIQLPSSVVLSSGFYWVSVQARMNFVPDGQWYWTNRSTQDNAPATWQNPGGGFGNAACTNWATRAGTCAINPGFPDQIFQIIGTLGGGGCTGSTPTATSTSTRTPTNTPTRTATNTPTATATATGTPLGRTAFDYDGDRRSDISVFRPSNGGWYVQNTQTGFYAAQFGISTDRIAPADYDGDGKTDIAVYRQNIGVWYILRSSDGAVVYYVFGIAEDLPVPADYDGDARADICVFRPSSGVWYWQNSSNGQFGSQPFGQFGDKPIVGNFDGDGRSDIAVWRPSIGGWYWINSSSGLASGLQFGISTDLTVPADYDGDRKTDVAVFRPSDTFWYILKSSGGADPIIYRQWGTATDIPAPADFSGDGKADICVFRPSNGTWYSLNSANGAINAPYQFGMNGDKPTQAAFRY